MMKRDSIPSVCQIQPPKRAISTVIMWLTKCPSRGWLSSPPGSRKCPAHIRSYSSFAFRMYGMCSRSAAASIISIPFLPSRIACLAKGGQNPGIPQTRTPATPRCPPGGYCPGPCPWKVSRIRSYQTQPYGSSRQMHGPHWPKRDIDGRAKLPGRRRCLLNFMLYRIGSVVNR